MTVHDRSLLLVSIAALALAPLLYRIADAARATLLALDGFVMFAIAGLVLIHILPQALAAAGPLALVLTRSRCPCRSWARSSRWPESWLRPSWH